MSRDKQQKPSEQCGMEQDGNWSLSNYDYDLDEQRIAQQPAKQRTGSRLYVLDRAKGDSIQKFASLDEHLPQDALVVLNNSKVVPARLHGCSASGKKAEFLLLTPLPLLEPEDDSGWRKATCHGLLKGAKRFKPGDRINLGDALTFTLRSKGDFGRVQGELSWQGGLETQMAVCGEPPLPPYIKRQSAPEDLGRYQTVYASDDQAGSVAAPTAGLHFDEEHLQLLKQRGLEFAEVTLYVGYGTFSPIRCEDIREHCMHAEYVRIPQESADAIAAAKSQGRPVVAVGTTVVRTLEGAVREAGELAAFEGWVELFIRPGFEFRVVDHMLTNFHLPKSSLLVLVSAFAGRRRVLHAYERALNAGFRVFSYGDAMLII